MSLADLSSALKRGDWKDTNAIIAKGKVDN